jgi:dCMP deaminase
MDCLRSLSDGGIGDVLDAVPTIPAALWPARFMNAAKMFGSWSKDPSSQVGCVLVNEPRKEIIGIGYNGLPRGVQDTEERLTNREIKYEMVKHAEENAVLNAIVRPAGATAYATHFPCPSCTGTLIQAGVSRIVTRRPSGSFAERHAARFPMALEMAREAGVEIVFLEEE